MRIVRRQRVRPVGGQLPGIGPGGLRRHVRYRREIAEEIAGRGGDEHPRLVTHHLMGEPAGELLPTGRNTPVSLPQRRVRGPQIAHRSTSLIDRSRVTQRAQFGPRDVGAVGERRDPAVQKETRVRRHGETRPLGGAPSRVRPGGHRRAQQERQHRQHPPPRMDPPPRQAGCPPRAGRPRPSPGGVENQDDQGDGERPVPDGPHAQRRTQQRSGRRRHRRPDAPRPGQQDDPGPHEHPEQRVSQHELAQIQHPGSEQGGRRGQRGEPRPAHHAQRGRVEPGRDDQREPMLDQHDPGDVLRPIHQPQEDRIAGRPPVPRPQTTPGLVEVGARIPQIHQPRWVGDHHQDPCDHPQQHQRAEDTMAPHHPSNPADRRGDTCRRWPGASRRCGGACRRCRGVAVHRLPVSQALRRSPAVGSRPSRLARPAAAHPRGEGDRPPSARRSRMPGADGRRSAA